MSSFKKRFEIPCDCFLPPVPLPQIGATGPTGPTAIGCCPCTNILDNPGFDVPGIPGDAVPRWVQTGAVTEAPDPDTHSGRFRWFV